MKTLVIGSCVCDVSIYLDHLPSTEEDINTKAQKMSLGGCAYNVSNMLRLFSVPYMLYAPVGTGIFGDYVDSHLRAQGVMPARRVQEENGACYCLIDEEGNRSFMALHGAEYHIHKDWLDELDMHAYDMVYVCGLELEETTGEEILSFLEEHRELKVVFASGPRIQYIQKDRMERMMKLYPLWHLNGREGRTLLGDMSLSAQETVKRLHSLSNGAVIMTNGGNPVTVYDNGVRSIPVEKAEAVDGNGAGDAHIGTVMALLQKGFTLENAIQKANLISAAVLGTKGAVLPDDRFNTIKDGILR
jgi:sugar/nucleoside kinase (ribokinase family)